MDWIGLDSIAFRGFESSRGREVSFLLLCFCLFDDVMMI